MNNPETAEYIDNLLIHNILPTIVMPTRITEKTATVIDHIYYYMGNSVSSDYSVKCGNLWCDITDHLPNYFLLLSNQNKGNSIARPFVRIFSKSNIEQFIKTVRDVDWNPVYQSTDVNNGYAYFENKMVSAFNECFPRKRLSRKRMKDKKWITAGIKQSIKHKNRIYKKWLKTHSHNDEENYKNYRRLLKSVIHKAKEIYYKELFNFKSNSIKQLWKNLNSVSSFRKNKTTNVLSVLNNNNNYVTDPAEISAAFNNYFCNISSNLNNSTGINNAGTFKKYCPSPSVNSMYCEAVTSCEVIRIIGALKNNKSPGYDCIGPKILKSVVDFVVNPLVHLYNMSFQQGIVPSQLKIAKVIPVFKKGDKTRIENYRPISLLSIFDKVLEKLMHKRLYEYLQKANILNDYQFGFRKHHSTSLALIDVVDSIYSHLDLDEIVMGIYVDLHKAFDTVNHDILLYKLYNYGVRGSVFSWFKDYLTNRQQFVSVSNAESKKIL